MTKEEIYQVMFRVLPLNAQYITSDKLTPKTPGLAELGVPATLMEKTALSYLRMYRRHAVHDEILEEP